MLSPAAHIQRHVRSLATAPLLLTRRPPAVTAAASGDDPVRRSSRWRCGPALAPRAPVRGPVRVAEPARTDALSAAAARPPGSTVDGPRGLRAGHGRAHRRPRPAQQLQQLLAGRLTHGSHGETRACQSDSAAQMFPIPDTNLWSSSTSPSGRPGSALRTAATRSSGLDTLRRARPAPTRATGTRVDLQHRPVPLNRRPARAAQDEPRPAQRPARPPAVRASARSSADGCERSDRPRTEARGSCRPPRPSRAASRRLPAPLR